jgi:hypothetical protein
MFLYGGFRLGVRQAMAHALTHHQDRVLLGPACRYTANLPPEPLQEQSTMSLVWSSSQRLNPSMVRLDFRSRM